ncbi:MAG: hypothetical protein ABI947_17540 [Chloroflexota bacterium]
MMRRSLICLAACLFAASCTTPPPLPTVSSFEMAQTAQHLTQNAPPPGFDQSVQFPKIDNNLGDQTNWRYTLSLSFEGVFTGSTTPAKGQIDAEVFSNEQAGERRVLLKASGAAFGLTENRNVEGVRIRNDYYVVNANKVCTKIDQPDSGQVANLAAGSLIGGVKSATPLGQRKTENKVDLWEYTFTPDNVIPPTMQLGTGGKYSIVAGDMWVEPSAKAVWQYSITLNVENATLQGDRPVTGQLHAAYQLVETGVQYNIAIPYGC